MGRRVMFFVFVSFFIPFFFLNETIKAKLNKYKEMINLSGRQAKQKKTTDETTLFFFKLKFNYLQK